MENRYLVYHAGKLASSGFFFINIDRTGLHNFIIERLEETGKLCDNKNAVY